MPEESDHLALTSISVTMPIISIIMGLANLFFAPAFVGHGTTGIFAAEAISQLIGGLACFIILFLYQSSNFNPKYKITASWKNRGL